MLCMHVANCGCSCTAVHCNCNWDCNITSLYMQSTVQQQPACCCLVLHVLQLGGRSLQICIAGGEKTVLAGGVQHARLWQEVAYPCTTSMCSVPCKRYRLKLPSFSLLNF